MRTTSKTLHLTAVLLAALLAAAPAMAATITVGGGCTLADAINAANTDAAAGGCPAGDPGLDTIELTTAVTLSAIDNVGTAGNNGLPVVTSDININGNGFSIKRPCGNGIDEFRFFEVDGADLNLDSVTLRCGVAEAGGAIFNDEGDVNLFNSTVSGNSAYGPGGGILNEGELGVYGSTISGNQAGEGGGGIANYDGFSTLTYSEVLRNSAIVGGGISNRYGSLIGAYATRVVDNEAEIFGGGIFNFSYASYFGAVNRVLRNEAGFAGGGIANLSYTGGSNSYSEVAENRAGELGGGLLYINTGDFGGGPFGGVHLLYNTTVSGNRADELGGGIYAAGYTFAYASYDTVAKNRARDGANVHNNPFDAPGLVMRGSVIGHPKKGDNCAGPPIDAGGNLADDDSCGSIPDTLTGLAAGLADNGNALVPAGPFRTKTHQLLAGSSAIDNGGDCFFPFFFGGKQDQRFFDRDELCDAGAFERTSED